MKRSKTKTRNSQNKADVPAAAILNRLDGRQCNFSFCIAEFDDIINSNYE